MGTSFGNHTTIVIPNIEALPSTIKGYLEPFGDGGGIVQSPQRRPGFRGLGFRFFFGLGFRV